MIGPMQLLHYIFIFVMFHDFVQMLFVDVAVVDGEGDTGRAKTSRSPNTMLVDLGVCKQLAVDLECRHVVVDDQLRLRHVDATGNHVGCDEHVNFLVTELLDS